jgi:superfamily II DNA or RNA helicase
MNESRRVEQLKALTNWKLNNFFGTALCCTGFGKTFLGIVASCSHIKRDPDQKWLVLVPTVNLIDQWRAEAYKWGYGEIWDKGVTCICYQSAYKFEGKHFSGIVADEIHIGLSPEYRKIFLKNTYDKLLCLTATEPENEEYNKFLQSISPTVYSMSLEEAVELNIIAPFKIYCIGVDLTEEERLEYNKAHKAFVYYKMLLGEFGAFDKATKILANKNLPTEEKALTKYKQDRRNALMFYKAIRDRGAVPKKAINKLDLTKEIIELFENRRVITFSESNNFTDQIYNRLGNIALRYHSGISKPLRAKILEVFRSGLKRVLCSTKGLNAGLDVPGVSLGIINGLNSKALPLIQRVGRVVRFEKNKLGYIFIIYVKNSQEEVWLNNAISQMNTKNIMFINNLTEVQNV